MKKYISLIIVFMLLFINIDLHATSYKFVWEDTLVVVPYGESVEKYKDIPKAHLYVDGKIVEDANVTYNRDGDWLCYLKDVDSTILKDYYVWYKAYENDVYRPGTCTDYKCKIQFKIVDEVSPTIKILNDNVNINSNISNFDILSNVSIFDNCDDDLNISYSPKFETLGIGSHEIKIYATDKSGNSSEASYNLNIVDSTLPYIIKTKSDELLFDLGTKPSLEGYFEAYDDIDGNITEKINYPSINTDKEGKYQYEISVMDSSLNVAKLMVDVIIKDMTIPEIELNKETDILNYKTDFNNFNYLKYVSKIIDNDIVNYDNLKYETNLENKVGTYYIRYKYNDGSNSIYKDLIIKLVSYDKPKIETDSILILVGSFVDLKNYINVYDDSDSNIKSSMIIDDEFVNYYKEGSYFVNVYVINSSGISNEEKIEIKVLNQNDYNKMMNINQGPNINNYLNIILISIIIIFIFSFTFFIIYLKKKKKI